MNWMFWRSLRFGCKIQIRLSPIQISKIPHLSTNVRMFVVVAENVVVVLTSYVDRVSVSRRHPHQHLNTSFENIHISLKAGNSHLNIYVIYRPPPNNKNGLTVDYFLGELAQMFEESHTLLRDIDSNGMTQHVNCLTHKRGHILDLVIARTSSVYIWRIRD